MVRHRLAVLLVPTLAMTSLAIPAGAEPDQDEIQRSIDEYVVLGEPILSEPHIDYVSQPSDADRAEAAEIIAELDASGPSVRALPEGVQFARAGGDFVLDYRTSIPNEMKTVFDAVMVEWSQALEMNGAGVHIEIYYQQLSGSTLAATGTYRVAVTDQGETFAIPTALVNARAGSDQYPYDSDIRVYVNSSVNWNTALAGAVPGDQYSLYTTMLHEIGHGLGFWGDIAPDSVAGDLFSSFDMRVYHDAGTSTGVEPALPIRTAPNPVTRTDRSWFRNLDGTWERIYDPVTYQDGSSMSHFDEWTYPAGDPTNGALMTPALAGSEVIYNVDNVTLGVMEASGWKIKRPPQSPQIVSAAVGATSVEVVIAPSRSSDGPPAAVWDITIWNGQTTVVALHVDAVERSVSVPIFLGAGDYQIVVSGRGSGGSSAAVSRLVSSNNVTPAEYDNCRRAPVNPNFATDDATKASLYRLYCSYFLRNPDNAGFDYWIEQYSSNLRTLDEISNFFTESTEFSQTYGALSDSEFVDLIYLNVMERPAEPDGFTFWVDQIGRRQYTRGQVMLFFSQSQEFQTKTGTN